MNFPGGGKIERVTLPSSTRTLYLVNYIGTDGFTLGFQHMETAQEQEQFAHSLRTVLKELDKRDIVIPGVRA